MFVASALFPSTGRAASTIRLPGWNPPVSASRSVKPDGVPVSPTSVFDSSSSLSISSWRIASSERISDVPLVVADLEQHRLGALDQLARLAAVGGHVVLDLARGLQHPPQQRVLLDDPRVVEDRADGGHHRRQRVEVRLAAGLLELALPRRSSSATVRASTASGSAFSFRRIIAWKIASWRGR